MLRDPLSISISSPPAPASRPVYPQRKLLQPSPDHPDDYILEIDYTRASDFMGCPRRAENLMIIGREKNGDTSATDFGTLFHSLEEQRLATGRLTPAVIQRQHELIAEHFLRHPPPAGDHRTADRMVQVIKLYNERYANDGWPQKVLKINGEPFVERPFKIELCTIEVNAVLPYFASQITTRKIEPETVHKDGYPFVRRLHILNTGKIDTILCESNLLFDVDHKTTSRGGKQFENAFRLSLQTRMYALAAQKILNRQIHGCIVNAAIIRPLTRTGVGTEFNRITHLYPQESLFEAERSMIAIVENFVSCLVKGYFPQQAQSFISPCDMCDFAENCALPVSQRAADLASDLYRDVTWNPMH